MTDTRITDYDVVFALHTGVTVMMPKMTAFDDCENTELAFTFDKKAENDVYIQTPAGESVIVADIRPDLKTEILARGFLMIYELEDDSIVRCIPCHIDI